MDGGAPNEDRFSDFLAAIKGSSERTRAVMYVNILIVALTVALLRNYAYPAWADARQSLHEEVVFCLNALYAKDEKDNPKSSLSEGDRKQCEADLPLMVDTNTLRMLELQPQLLGTIKTYSETVIKSVAHTRVFQIPFFNVSLDENDTWIVSGVFGLLSMSLLWLFLIREEEITRSAIPFIKTRAQCALVLATKTFSSTEELAMNHSTRRAGAAFVSVLFFAPCILHFLVFASDVWPLGQIQISARLIGPLWAWVEIAAEGLAGISLGLVGYRCLAANRAVDAALGEIVKRTHATKTGD